MGRRFVSGWIPWSRRFARCVGGKCKSPREVFPRKEILGMVLVGVEYFADHTKM